MKAGQGDDDGDPTNAGNPDLDLFLVDTNTLTDIQTSEGLGRQEEITVLAAGDGDGIDAGPDVPGDKSFPDEASSYHGTHVAGIVGAAGNNASGVAGVAALMKSVAPALSPADFDVLPAAGSLTQDLGGESAAVRNDLYGYGLIDAQKSVLAA
jgi:hypothetical protein